MIFSKVSLKHEEAAIEKSKLIIKEAELQGEKAKNTKILESKEQFLKLKAEFEDETNKKKNIILQNEQKLKQRDQNLSKMMEQNQRKEAELESMKENLTAQLEIVAKRKEDAEQMRLQQVSKLEKIANLTADDARNQIVEALKEEAKSKASSYIKDIVDEAKLTATKEAKKIIIETIQRTASETAVENCVSIFNIDSEDIKGKIIGREGRNIRALEAATGVEIIVDDTPDAIIISGFDPVRREVARLSLHRLVQDGRIHPARIEEIVAKTFKNIDDEIVNRRAYGDRLRYSWLAPRVDKICWSNEISFVLRSKFVTTLQRSGQASLGDGSRTRTKPQSCKTCRLATRYRQSANRRIRIATRTFGNGTGQKVQRVTRSMQRHRCPPRRDRNDLHDFAIDSNLRFYIWFKTRCSP